VKNRWTRFTVLADIAGMNAKQDSKGSNEKSRCQMLGAAFREIPTCPSYILFCSGFFPCFEEIRQFRFCQLQVIGIDPVRPDRSSASGSKPTESVTNGRRRILPISPR